MSNVSLVAVAKFVESAMNTGRSPIESLRLLTEEELTAVLTSFLKANGTQHVVKMKWVGSDRSKVDAFKAVREIISNCNMVDARNFIRGDGELVITNQQLTDLRNHFGDMIICK